MKSIAQILTVLCSLALFESPPAGAAGAVKVADPYKFVWDNDEGSLSGLVRFSMELNDDDVPEVFIAAKSHIENGGGGYHVFSHMKGQEYQYLGKIEINPLFLQRLSSKHNGFYDLKGYWFSTVADGDLNRFIFNGKGYEKTGVLKIRAVDIKKHLSPTKVILQESGLTLKWKP